MFRKKVGLLTFWLAAGDYLLITLVFLMAFFLRFGSIGDFLHTEFAGFLLLYFLVWSILANIFQIYSKYFEQEYLKQVRKTLQVLVIHLLVIVAINGTLKTFFSRAIIFNSYGFLLIALPLWRLVYNRILKSYFDLALMVKQAVFIGGENFDAMVAELESTRLSTIRVMGYFGPQGTYRFNHLGNVNDWFDYIVANADEIDEVYCSLSALSTNDLNRLINFADNNLIRIIFIPEAKGINFSKLKFDFIGEQPVMMLRPLPLDEPVNRLLKRIFDLIFSTLVILLVLTWLIPLLAIVIKMGSKGPVFFKQKRSGLNNRLFWCYKFRTMKVNKESDTVQAVKNDSRITPIGEFLRKTSLDEMPQFLNVFIGNMSVIGPRPHMISHTELYSKIVNKFMLRHFVKPGITGLSQVKGLRGETTEPSMMRNRVRIDIFYIENWSIWLDIRIVYLTVYNMIRGDKNAF